MSRQADYRLTRRQMLLLVGGGGASLLAAACSPISSSTPAPAPSSAVASSTAGASTAAAPSAGAPRSGGTLQYGRVSDINTPDGANTDQANFVLAAQVYDTLTSYDDHLTPQPALAESWEFSTDQKQLKINLRKGVQFHNGRELTSEDVRYTTLRVRDPKVGAQIRTLSAWITDIQTPDKSTVIYTLDAPRPAIFDLLEFMNVVDQSAVEGPDAARSANGTGPFKFTEWVPGQRVRLTRNPSYWMSGRPYLDEVVIQIIKDPQALLVQLESGAIHIVESAPERDAARYQQTSGYQVVLQNQGSQMYYIAANTTRPPFTDKRVRQAINYAIDRKRFLSSVLSGIGEATDLPWTSASPAYDPSKIGVYDHDLDKAKSLLEQAGATGAELSLVTNGGNPPLADQAQHLQADLAQIGVKLTVQNLQVPVWRDQFFNTSYQGLLSGPFGFTNLHPSSLFLLAAPFLPTKGTTGFKSDAYAQIVQAASIETDANAQKDIFRQLNDLLLDESFVMPMVQQKPNLVLNAKAHGASRRLTGAVTLRDAWLNG